MPWYVGDTPVTLYVGDVAVTPEGEAPPAPPAATPDLFGQAPFGRDPFGA